MKIINSKFPVKFLLLTLVPLSSTIAGHGDSRKKSAHGQSKVTEQALLQVDLSKGGVDTGGGIGWLIEGLSQTSTIKTDPKALLDLVKLHGRHAGRILKDLKEKKPEPFKEITQGLGITDPSLVDSFSQDFSAAVEAIKEVKLNENLPDGRQAEFHRSTGVMDIHPYALASLSRNPEGLTALIFHEIVGLMGYGEWDSKERKYPAAVAFYKAYDANRFELVICPAGQEAAGDYLDVRGGYEIMSEHGEHDKNLTPESYWDYELYNSLAVYSSSSFGYTLTRKWNPPSNRNSLNKGGWWALACRPPKTHY